MHWSSRSVFLKKNYQKFFIDPEACKLLFVWRESLLLTSVQGGDVQWGGPDHRIPIVFYMISWLSLLSQTIRTPLPPYSWTPLGNLYTIVQHLEYHSRNPAPKKHPGRNSRWELKSDDIFPSWFYLNPARVWNLGLLTTENRPGAWNLTPLEGLGTCFVLHDFCKFGQLIMSQRLMWLKWITVNSRSPECSNHVLLQWISPPNNHHQKRLITWFVPSFWSPDKNVMSKQHTIPPLKKNTYGKNASQELFLYPTLMVFLAVSLRIMGSQNWWFGDL